jgi:hypothetical protein
MQLFKELRIPLIVLVLALLFSWVTLEVVLLDYCPLFSHGVRCRPWPNKNIKTRRHKGTKNYLNYDRKYYETKK